MRNNGNRNKDERIRLSGYVTPQVADWWNQKLDSLKEDQGLSPKNGIGVLMTRVALAEFDFRLESELVHKPVKRARAAARAHVRN